MTPTAAITSDFAPGAVVQRRIAAMGLACAHCDAGGAVGEVSAPVGSFAERALKRFLTGRRVAERLREAANAWAGGEDNPVELCPGFWAAPLPLTERRRVQGFLVALAPTHDGLAGDGFARACADAGLTPSHAVGAFAPIAVASREEVARLQMALRWSIEDRAEIAADEETLEGFSAQLAESYEEISLLYKLGRSMNELAQPDNFVAMTCDELYATLPFRWVAAGFSRDAGRLAGHGFLSGDAAGETRAVNRLIERLIRDASQQEPAIVPGPDGEVLARPLFRDGQCLGALIAGDKHGDDPQISSVDMKMIDGAARLVGVMLENAGLYEQQQSMFLGTLEALTASIDAKDPYTSGHSQRVAALATRLAAAAGLSDETVERVRIAGLVHDVGKIGVPESVLCKPGRLTDEEFAIIKTHPEIGHRILKDIPQFSDVLPGVLHHHERWDGRGYPHGLEGEQTPLFARILAVADSFDAMSSTRTYRAAMPRSKVLSEIERCAGEQFDPDLAPVFVRLDLGFFDEMIREQAAAARAAAKEAA